MDPVPPKAPLFEIHMKLINRKIDFVPSLDNDDFGSLIGIMNYLLNDINGLALLVPRISYLKRDRTYMVFINYYSFCLVSPSSIIIFQLNCDIVFSHQFSKFSSMVAKLSDEMLNLLKAD